MAIRIEPQSEPIPGYKLLERLGGGGFGEVWKVEAPGGLLKAIKIVHGDMETAGGESQKADQELKALRRVITVRHPYILSLERFDIVDGRLLIVMELADRNLADRAKSYRTQGLSGIPREELLNYMEETAEALDLMNVEYQLQHLDVKPQNLFLVHNHIKVADFGLVKDLQDRMAATITGGVTPVYAAPETFDGWVSRYCDQYSLGIVYQELLTGQRPFSATNVHQLVMQHVQGKPNLESLPPEDREIIARALAKNPDDRFPSCMDLVRALRGQTAIVQGASAREPAAEVSHAPSPAEGGGFSTTMAAPQRGKFVPEDHVPAAEPASPPSPPATAEIHSDGDLVPALVIGLGHLGLVGLNALAQQFRARFGSTDALPHVRLLGIDTDAYSLPHGPGGNHALDGDSALHRHDMLIAKLNRAGYYLNPRNGRTGIDSWFDLNMLFRIRREPITGGMRALGRLAFFGNYRTISARLEAELKAVTNPQAWAAASQRTNLSLRIDQPRVYVLVSLAGGTGGGMFIDLAYVIRNQLQNLGYQKPVIVGLFLLPTTQGESPGTLPLGNSYAALTELNHFSTINHSGLKRFTARYDEREKPISATTPPYTRCVFLPALADNPDPEVTARIAGECLAYELTTPLGRFGDAGRKLPTDGEIACQSFGWFRCTWPRRLVSQGASQRLCRQLVQRWLAKTVDKPVQEQIAAIVNDKWKAAELGADFLIARFQQSCADALGKDTESALQAILDPLLAKRSAFKESDREMVQHALGEIDRILGQPTDSCVMQRAGVVDEALKTQTELVNAEWQKKLDGFTLDLLEQPEFRLAGAEEAVRQTSRLIEQVLTHHEPLSKELTRNCVKASERLRFLVANFPSIFKNRKPDPLLKELVELFVSYSKWRYQGLVIRRVIYTYTGLRGFLSDQIREVGFYRLRLGELAAGLRGPSAEDLTRLVPHGQVIYPTGCDSLASAINQLVPHPTPEELSEIDRRVQPAIEQQFGSLRHVCTTPSVSLKSLEAAMLVQAESFVSARIPAENVVDVFLERHGCKPAAQHAVAQALAAAAPPLIDADAARGHTLAFVAVPTGQEEEVVPLLPQADAKVHVLGLRTTDDLIYYQEAPCDIAGAIDSLGPAAEDAYRQLLDADHFTPHSRTDISEWYDQRSPAFVPRPAVEAR
jgi:hypothetical protein